MISILNVLLVAFSLFGSAIGFYYSGPVLDYLRDPEVPLHKKLSAACALLGALTLITGAILFVFGIAI